MKEPDEANHFHWNFALGVPHDGGVRAVVVGLSMISSQLQALHAALAEHANAKPLPEDVIYGPDKTVSIDETITHGLGHALDALHADVERLSIRAPKPAPVAPEPVRWFKVHGHQREYYIDIDRIFQINPRTGTPFACEIHLVGHEEWFGDIRPAEEVIAAIDRAKAGQP